MHSTHDPAWWAAYLATTIKHAVAEPEPQVTNAILKGGLTKFVQSPACTTDLRTILKTKGEK